jgi:hypothetical protein
MTAAATGDVINYRTCYYQYSLTYHDVTALTTCHTFDTSGEVLEQAGLSGSGDIDDQFQVCTEAIALLIAVTKCYLTKCHMLLRLLHPNFYVSNTLSHGHRIVKAIGTAALADTWFYALVCVCSFNRYGWIY